MLLAILITAISYMIAPLIFLVFVGKQERKTARTIAIINSVCVHLIFMGIEYMVYGAMVGTPLPAFTYYFINVAILTKRKPKNSGEILEEQQELEQEKNLLINNKIDYKYDLSNQVNQNQTVDYYLSPPNNQDDNFNNQDEDLIETEDEDIDSMYEKTQADLFFKEFDKGYRKRNQDDQRYLTNLSNYLSADSEQCVFIYDVYSINEKYKKLRDENEEKFSFADIVILNINILSIKEILDEEQFKKVEEQYFSILNSSDFNDEYEVDKKQYCKLVVYAQNLFAKIANLKILLNGNIKK